MPGDHNVLNACAAYLAAVVGLGAEPTAVLHGLAGFTGARRRFEVRGSEMGVTVVDDYAHNPAKVSAVVGTGADIVRRSGGAWHVIFQPHLYPHADFARDFARALAPADHVQSSTSTALASSRWRSDRALIGDESPPARGAEARRRPDPRGCRGVDGASGSHR